MRYSNGIFEVTVEVTIVGNLLLWCCRVCCLTGGYYSITDHAARLAQPASDGSESSGSQIPDNYAGSN